MGILVSTAFEILSTTNRLKCYTLGQLIFFFGIIFPIKHKVDLKLIRQKIRRRINKDNIHKNIIIIYYNYKVSDKVMLNNKAVYKY